MLSERKRGSYPGASTRQCRDIPTIHIKVNIAELSMFRKHPSLALWPRRPAILSGNWSSILQRGTKGISVLNDI